MTHVLIVDDSRSSVACLSNAIEKITGCTITGSTDPVIALAMCQHRQFDIVIVDYLMPEMNGIELIRNLRAIDDFRHVPIVMVTSDQHAEVRHLAIEAGATDFLNKPVDAAELAARLRNLIALRLAQVRLADVAQNLAHEVRHATCQLAAREEEIIWRLARAIEYRDAGTGEHVSRVAAISRQLAEQIGLPDETCRTIYLAAPLHDVGKIGISDAIIGKPGRLTVDEIRQMRRHTEIGFGILEGGNSELLRIAARIARSHHERWDGTGYPDGLSGAQIPVEARIVAVADVFDALRTQRPYKPAWSFDQACDEIERCSGTQFDPACVRAFVRVKEGLRPARDTTHQIRQTA